MTTASTITVTLNEGSSPAGTGWTGSLLPLWWWGAVRVAALCRVHGYLRKGHSAGRHPQPGVAGLVLAACAH